MGMHWLVKLGMGLALATALIPGEASAAAASCIGSDGSTCDVANNGFGDSFSCSCAGGLGVGGGGGNDWAGLSDEEMDEICLEQISEHCGPPPPPEWDCETDFGACDIVTDEDVFVYCDCAGGGGGAGPGDDDWADLDEDELEEVCVEQISEFCGAPEPTGESSGSSETGDTTESGTTDATESGTTDATESGTTDATETGTTDATETGASTTGNDDESASMTGATMTGGASESSSETSGGAPSENADGGGCSCDARGDDRSGLLGFGVLGLLGLRSRRRR